MTAALPWQDRPAARLEPDAPCCWRCTVPLDPSDVVTLAGVGFCVACAERETGEAQ